MKRVLTLGLLVMLVGLFTVSLAGAQTVPGSVGTGATVGAGTSAPVTVNAFMLPDMNTANANPSIDLIAPYEDAPDGGFVNVTPSLFNTPQRFMGFWAIMSSPAGIGDIQDVWVDVLHPDGTFKYQVHLSRVNIAANLPNAGAVDCARLGTATTAGTPLAGAVTTGQKTTAEAAAIVDQCLQGIYAPYFGVAEITKDQPFGAYSYTVGATSRAGASSRSTTVFHFDVLQRAGLALDFSSIAWGAISPLSGNITDGDSTWGLLPSVASVGNVWLNLRVDFDPMAGIVPGAINFGKVIDVFDVVLGSPFTAQNPLGQTRVTVDPIRVLADGSTADAVTITNFILPSDCPTKIQFSIHPEIMGTLRTASGQTGVPAGAYVGAVKLSGVKSTAQWTAGWQALLAQCMVDIPPTTPGGTVGTIAQ